MAWAGVVENSWNTRSVESGRAGSAFFTAPHVLGDLVGVALLSLSVWKTGENIIWCSSPAAGVRTREGGGDERASCTPAGLLPTGAPLLSGAALPLGLTVPPQEKAPSARVSKATVCPQRPSRALRACQGP